MSYHKPMPNLNEEESVYSKADVHAADSVPSGSVHPPFLAHPRDPDSGPTWIRVRPTWLSTSAWDMTRAWAKIKWNSRMEKATTGYAWRPAARHVKTGA